MTLREQREQEAVLRRVREAAADASLPIHDRIIAVENLLRLARQLHGRRPRNEVRALLSDALTRLTNVVADYEAGSE